MVKKIIDVYNSAEFIHVNCLAVTSTGDLTTFSSARYSANELEDAPTVVENEPVENNVIELPANVIEGVQNTKSYWENVAGFVLNVPSIVFPEIRKSIGEPNASYDKVADILVSWYFGNIDFVPKKEPRFIVSVDSPTGIGRAEKDDNGNIIIEYYEFDVATRLFTEAEADELVAGLTALNARKVKAED